MTKETNIIDERIAHFMGLEYRDEPGFSNKYWWASDGYYKPVLLYSKKWNALHEVITKIECLKYRNMPVLTEIVGNECSIFSSILFNYNAGEIKQKRTTKFLAVYFAVDEFITFYNNNTNLFKS